MEDNYAIAQQRIEAARRQASVRLNLSGLGLQELPPELFALTQLRVLWLSDNQLTSLPPEIGALLLLERLRLNKNALTALPLEFGELTELRELWLHDNQLPSLPDTFWQLTQLRTLILNGNQLTELPAAIARLQELRKLSLGSYIKLRGKNYRSEVGNQLTAVPVELSQLSQLQELWLSNNQLTAVPVELSQLSQLQSLWLSNNQLTAVPVELSQLSQLQYLRLSNNQLTAVPVELSQLSQLQSLRLDNNQLTAVPVELSQLSQLQYLRLYNNQLTAVPVELSQLSQLQSLWLDNNQLTAVPVELSQLSQLQYLRLDNNQLTAVPVELSQLSQLRQLRLDGNADLKIPPEVTEEGIATLLDFIGQAPQPHWASKLMLVGEGGVGKSSLLRALLGKKFVKDLQTTHGLKFGKLMMPHPRRPEIAMQLNTWDFGGQQIYHATHQFFLTERSLYLLVWDGRSSFEACRVRNWLETLALRVPSATVLLVATNVEERPADLPFSQLTEQYSRLHKTHFSVSNKTGAGIAELRQALTEAAAELPLMGELSPPAWTAVKAALRKQAKKQRSIVLAELEDVMSAHGITAPASQKRLTRFLHELGEIIHYPDNPELKDTVILDAEWVSKTISLVLDNAEVKDELGLFSRELMEKLWRRLDPGQRAHMLGLMEEFNLSYRIPDDPRDISLVVERLRHDPPPDWDKAWNNVPEPRREITLLFELETTLPPGIPTWFIAQQHEYTTHTHWLRGVVLADDRHNPKHWALLEAYPEDKYLRLTVRGPAPFYFRSKLLAGLRKTFYKYKGLEKGDLRLRELVPCLGRRRDEPCDYKYNLEDLDDHWNDDPPITTFKCIRCRTMLSVRELLEGIRFDPTYEKLEAIEAVLHATRAEVHAEGEQTRTQMSEQTQDLTQMLQYEFTTHFNALQQYEETQSPYVFVLRGGAYEGDLQGLFGGTGVRGGMKDELRERFWKRKMELQLYCQMPGHWHPCGYERGKDDPATGLYQVEINAEFLQALAPHLPKMVKLLNLAQPFVKAAQLLAGLPAVTPDVARWTASIKDDHEHMLKLAEKIPSLEESAEAKLTRGLGEARTVTEASGAMLRMLKRLLEEKDKDRVWGGLERHYVKAEGHHLWLCPDHLAEYKQ